MFEKELKSVKRWTVLTVLGAAGFGCAAGIVMSWFYTCIYLAPYAHYLR